jgi:hypothetical protein
LIGVCCGDLGRDFNIVGLIMPLDWNLTEIVPFKLKMSEMELVDIASRGRKGRLDLIMYSLNGDYMIH